MKAMILEKPGSRLRLVERPVPKAGRGRLLIRVKACGVCRTDLHVADGELDRPKLPLVLGHEIVGVVEEVGPGVEGFSVGRPVGVPWLGWTDGRCRWCLSGRENLCPNARFTGYTLDGGYAEYVAADARYCFPLPKGCDGPSAAPLMCAGMIGWRSLRAAGEAERLGLYGFGAAAHIIVQIARHQGRTVYAFVRPGDSKGRSFAKSLGAHWAGDSDRPAPVPLDAAILYAPVGALVPAALRAVAPGGNVVCAGIHMSDIPSFPYSILWKERSVKSVANLTREDGRELLKIAPKAGVRTTTRLFPLERANEALAALREGRIEGAAVLTP
jgi:propanol-preferring alcohol dehydrogenase